LLGEKDKKDDALRTQGLLEDGGHSSKKKTVPSRRGRDKQIL